MNEILRCSAPQNAIKREPFVLLVSKHLAL